VDVVRDVDEPFFNLIKSVRLLPDVPDPYRDHGPTWQEPAARPKADPAVRVAALALWVPAVVADDLAVSLEANCPALATTSRRHGDRLAVDAVPPGQVEVARGTDAIGRDRGHAPGGHSRRQRREGIGMPDKHEVEGSDPIAMAGGRADEG